MNVRRVASVGSALAVGGIAAYASYSHMRHLAIEYGQDRTVATLLPVSVDGLMVVATIALGDGRQNRWSAWLAFWAGVAASVIANVLAAQPSGIARTISAWPAVAFLLVVEVITRRGRRRVGESFAEVVSDPASTEVAAEQVDPWAYSTPIGGGRAVSITAMAANRQAETSARLAEVSPEPASTPADPPRQRTTTAKPPASKTATDTANGRQAVIEAHRQQPTATNKEIAEKAGVSLRTVERHRPARETANGHAVPELVAATTAKETDQ